VRFGILTSHQYDYGDDLQARLRDLWELVELARDLGFHSAWTINHFLANFATPQPISMTAKLLEHSGDMQVGTSILLLPLFHPIHVAEEFATLDHLSRGRVVLGVGAGYRDNELEAFGIDKPSRFRRMDEAIRLIRALWTGERISFEGEFYSVRDQRIGIPPYTPGGPPIYIGAGSRKAVQRAARLGDSWRAPGNSPNPDYLAKHLAIHDEALAKAGKSRAGRDYSVGGELYCAATTEEARAEALPYARAEYAAYAEYPALRWQRDRFDELIANTLMLGSPGDLIDRIRKLEALGINHLIFRPTWVGMPIEQAKRSIALFAHEVMPAFPEPIEAP
jgi:alkanesulfonate monooxygenase SsuD/methylene tetrahydromethanopterin reductase-like flavin-dependent oxidoreductase (luciferase family)